MSRLELLFKKFINSIIKNKSIINSLKIIEKQNNVYLSSSKNYVVYKKKLEYNKDIQTGKFIDNSIVDFINNKLIYKINYKYYYYDLKIEINIICSKNDLIIIDNKYKKLLLRIITFINLNKDIIKKDLLLNVYLTKFNKKFNNCILHKNKNIILGAKNVNSGFTDGTFITLYRTEENLKVLIHELIHYYNIDKINRDITCNECKKRFNISNNTTIIINEGFVETWANILNTLYIVFENNRFNYNILNVSTNNQKNIEYNNLFKKFTTILKIEQNFALLQTAKILLNYNFNDYNDFLNNSNKIKALKQSSSIFSYYIAKCIFLYNINKFLYLYFNNKLDEGIFIIDYKKKDLIDLLITNSTNTKLMKIINEHMKIIKIKKKCSESLLNLRMTSSPLSNL